MKGSVRRHRVPAWWLDAKLGIFIHWTPASVAGWAPVEEDIGEILSSTDPTAMSRTPYTEWYENSLRFPDSPVSRYHRATFGDLPYTAFAERYEAGLESWDPDDWAARFAAAGARYVVLVTKHHDGFCLWPSSVANPNRPGWHTRRDVVGELAEAVRARGLRFGVYYSGGLDWTFDDRPLGSTAEVAASVPGSEAYRAYAEAQVWELIERYRPSVLWNDIAWPFGGERLWRLFAHYYEAVPDGVVNDRWMPRTLAWDALRFAPVRRLVDLGAARSAASGGLMPPTPPHYDVRTPEYTVFPDVQRRPWECVRGIDRSFGYNRGSDESLFLGHDELLESVSDITAKGGNLLLNVGPRGEDAGIPDEQQRRLDWLGEWLAVAGPAVYGSRPWVRAEATTAEGRRVRFTATGEDVHAIVFGPPAEVVTIPGVRPSATGDVEVLGLGPVAWSPVPGAVRVEPGTAVAGRVGPLVVRITRAEALPV